MTRRKGRSGHCDRKQITQAQIARPVRQAATRARKRNELAQHFDACSHWERRMLVHLGLAPAGRAA